MRIETKSASANVWRTWLAGYQILFAQIKRETDVVIGAPRRTIRTWKMKAPSSVAPQALVRSYVACKS